MSKRRITVATVSVFLASLLVVNASAQGGRQPKRGAQQDDPHAADRKRLNSTIKEAIPKIANSCTSLKDAIISANAASSELPYDDNQISGTFETDCQSGKLKWTAERKFSPTDADQRTYKLSVIAANAHQLGNSRPSPDGMVQLISETASITVDDGANGASQRVKWPLDLREEEYARRFALALKELSANLKTKLDAETELNKLPPEPAPPAPAEKGKVNKRNK